MATQFVSFRSSTGQNRFAQVEATDSQAARRFAQGLAKSGETVGFVSSDLDVFRSEISGFADQFLAGDISFQSLGTAPATSLAVSRPVADTNIGLQNGANAGAGQFATGGTGTVAPPDFSDLDTRVSTTPDQQVQLGGRGGEERDISDQEFRTLGETDIAGEEIEAGRDIPPPPPPDPSKITIGDVELIDFDEAQRLLQGGSIDAVITDYTQRVGQELPLPTAVIPGVGSVNVAFGTDLFNNSGWGYLDGDGQFVITAETNIAGQNFQRASEQIDQMEAFIQQVALAEDQSARNLLVSQELARVNAEFQLAQTGAAGEEARETVEFQGEITTEQQLAGQEFSREERLFREAFETLEAEIGRDFTTEERLAFQAFQESLETGRQEFTTEERLAREAEARAAETLGREFTSEEREAIQAFQIEREALARSQQVGDIASAEQFQTRQIQQGQEFQVGQTEQAQTFQTGREEDVQTFQAEQAVLTREFQQRRDDIDFQRQGLLESARSGIANALTPEGIDEAVRQADEARALERSTALIDIIESLSRSGLSRQLQSSGLLEQLSAEFGVDLSFLLRSGLDVGGGGTAPVRVTA